MSNVKTADNSQFGLVATPAGESPNGAASPGDGVPPLVDEHGRLIVSPDGSGPGADVNATIVDPLDAGRVATSAQIVGPLSAGRVSTAILSPIGGAGGVQSEIVGPLSSGRVATEVLNTPTTLNGVSGAGALGANYTHFHPAAYATVINAQVASGARRLMRARGFCSGPATVYVAFFDSVGSTAGVPVLQQATATAIGGAFDVDLTSIGGIAFATGIYAAVSTLPGSYNAATAIMWLEAWHHA